MASALTHNTAIGAWFQEQYQQPPWSCWQYTASGLPGAVPNNNPHESFWKEYKHYCLDGVRVGHKAFLHEVFPRSLFQMWPSRMGAPVRQIRFLTGAQLLEAESRLKHDDAVVQSEHQDREFFVRPGVFAWCPLPVGSPESCLPSVCSAVCPVFAQCLPSVCPVFAHSNPVGVWQFGIVTNESHIKTYANTSGAPTPIQRVGTILHQPTTFAPCWLTSKQISRNTMTTTRQMQTTMATTGGHNAVPT